MTISSNKNKPEPQAWQVWLAYLHFADHPDIGKVRPVVILNPSIDPMVVAKVTTAEPHGRYSYCDLSDWTLEGLERPSRVQTTPLFDLERKDLLNDEPLGVLSQHDKETLLAALRP